MKLTTAFFDLDGVLWNSEEAHYEAFQKVATKHRENYLNLSHAFAETWVFGIETSQVFLNAFSWMGVDISDNELLNLIAEKREAAKTIFESKDMINRDSIDLLKKFKRIGFQLGLVSGSSKQNVEMFLHKSKTANMFEIVLNSSDFDENKPAPDAYLLAMKALNVKAAECLVVEDSQSGLTSARKAGIKEIFQYPLDSASSTRLTAILKKYSYTDDHE